MVSQRGPDMDRHDHWKVGFYDSRLAWQEERSKITVDFEDGELARLWARTQELDAYPLTALFHDDSVVAMFIVAPRDGSLMRQERAEIPVIVGRPDVRPN